jgi:organic hydroperoxide reductase OsmC/OhrA
MDAHTRTGLAHAATHVGKIRLEARLNTDAALADLARVATETERRCPISNLIRDAGVQLETRWIRMPGN